MFGRRFGRIQRLTVLGANKESAIVERIARDTFPKGNNSKRGVSVARRIEDFRQNVETRDIVNDSRGPRSIQQGCVAFRPQKELWTRGDVPQVVQKARQHVQAARYSKIASPDRFNDWWKVEHPAPWSVSRPGMRKTRDSGLEGTKGGSNRA
ncbi:uncharacterized protein LOC143143797 [Ptiloglossa arizonensis]|uniref:uncharacterized protein LOC143143797 n=1 Tax=Ptiloglossa arizonensis TaxID=3350558 RepID=UPI003F9FA0B6